MNPEKHIVVFPEKVVLPENMADETIQTGYCHDDPECITLARLNGIEIGLNPDNGFRTWTNHNAVCCGCGEYINL